MSWYSELGVRCIIVTNELPDAGVDVGFGVGVSKGVPWRLMASGRALDVHRPTAPLPLPVTERYLEGLVDLKKISQTNYNIFIKCTFLFGFYRGSLYSFCHFYKIFWSLFVTLKNEFRENQRIEQYFREFYYKKI